jgi:hypothetical protein
MAGTQRIARIVIVGIIIGAGGVGLAAPAYANPCDATQLSMTPHQGTACLDPALVAPSPEQEPALGAQDATNGAQPAELAPLQAVADDGPLFQDPAMSPAAGDPDLTQP